MYKSLCKDQGNPRELLLITHDFLWITLLELCIKPVQTGGKVGEGTPQICGQFVDRQP